MFYTKIESMGMDNRGIKEEFPTSQFINEKLPTAMTPGCDTNPDW